MYLFQSIYHEIVKAYVAKKSKHRHEDVLRQHTRVGKTGDKAVIVSDKRHCIL